MLVVTCHKLRAGAALRGHTLRGARQAQHLCRRQTPPHQQPLPFLSLSPSHIPIHSLSLSHSLSFSPSLSPSLPLSLPHIHTLSIPLSFPLSLPPSLSPAHALSAFGALAFTPAAPATPTSWQVMALCEGGDLRGAILRRRSDAAAAVAGGAAPAPPLFPEAQVLKPSS
jgi:hypothetical protein